MIGLGFAWAVVRASIRPAPDVLAIPVGQLVEVVVAAVLVGVLAAIFPAWRASRLDVLGAITTD